MLLCELLENDDVRKAVKELRLKGSLGLFHDALLELLVVPRRTHADIEADRVIAL